MMDEDARELAGEAYERDAGKPGYRWGRAKGRIGFHRGKIEVESPWVRSKATGKEMSLPSWQGADEPDADEECRHAEGEPRGAPARGGCSGRGGIGL